MEILLDEQLLIWLTFQIGVRLVASLVVMKKGSDAAQPRAGGVCFMCMQRKSHSCIYPREP